MQDWSTWPKCISPTMTFVLRSSANRPVQFLPLWRDWRRLGDRVLDGRRVFGCRVATVSILRPLAGHPGCHNFLTLLLGVLASQTLIQQFILHRSQGLLSSACFAHRSPSSFQRL